MTSTYLLVVTTQGCTDPAIKGLFLTDTSAKAAFKTMFREEVVVNAWIYELTCGAAKHFQVDMCWVGGEWR